MSTHSRLTPLLNAALLLALVAPAQAATFNIDSCDAIALINAIDDANANGQADVINLNSDCTYTLTTIHNETNGNNGLPSITSTVTINGNGATIERSSAPGTPDFRLMRIAESGDLTLDQVTMRNGGKIAIIDRNVSKGRGGGFLNLGTVTLTHSTLSGNSAFSGGGFDNAGGTVTLTHSTLSDNSASNSGGGFNNNRDGTVNLINSTLSGNSADDSGGGIFNSQGGTLMLGNSLVAGNTAPTGQEIFNASVFVSEGHNLIGVNGVSGVEGATLAATDIIPAVGITAIIASLDNNGGPTPTHLLVLDSPAIDSGDNALIPTGITTDQRGFPRIQNGTVDIGAVEVAATTPIPTLSQWALLVLGLLLAGLPWLTQGGRIGRLR